MVLSSIWIICMPCCTMEEMQNWHNCKTIEKRIIFIKYNKAKKIEGISNFLIFKRSFYLLVCPGQYQFYLLLQSIYWCPLLSLKNVPALQRGHYYNRGSQQTSSFCCYGTMTEIVFKFFNQFPHRIVIYKQFYVTNVTHLFNIKNLVKHSSPLLHAYHSSSLAKGLAGATGRSEDLNSDDDRKNQCLALICCFLVSCLL